MTILSAWSVGGAATTTWGGPINSLDGVASNGLKVKRPLAARCLLCSFLISCTPGSRASVLCCLTRLQRVWRYPLVSLRLQRFFRCTVLDAVLETCLVDFINWGHIYEPFTNRISVNRCIICHNAIEEACWIARTRFEMPGPIMLCELPVDLRYFPRSISFTRRRRERLHFIAMGRGGRRRRHQACSHGS